MFPRLRLGADAEARGLDVSCFAAILNRMVKYSDQTLDRTFAALADPTRRALLARLRQRDGISVSKLAQPFAMSLAPIIKHLHALSDARLVAPGKTGPRVALRAAAGP